MKSLSEILKNLQEKDTGKYLKYEWQLYGYNLARYLDDMKRVSMYMKFAKTMKRNTLQEAFDFVKESNARSKPKLFLWKLSQLKAKKKVIQ